MTPRSLLHRFIALFLLLMLLPACSPTDSGTPSPTQTPIPATPTQTETATPSSTDTPTATPTPTDKPSYLSQLAPWKEGMGDSRDNFPMVDMANASDGLREAYGKLVKNNDGSSTWDGKPLFAADAPIGRLVPFGGEGLYKVSGYDGFFVPLCGYKADYVHGGAVEGETEYRMFVAINTENGPVILDVIYRIEDPQGRFRSLDFDNKLPDTNVFFKMYFAPPSNDIDRIINFPMLMRVGKLNDQRVFELYPDYVDFYNQAKEFVLPQIFVPTGIVLTD